MPRDYAVLHGIALSYAKNIITLVRLLATTFDGWHKVCELRDTHNIEISQLVS